MYSQFLSRLKYRVFYCCNLDNEYMLFNNIVVNFCTDKNSPLPSKTLFSSIVVSECAEYVLRCQLMPGCVMDIM
jgi:hypothetical protein